jgi:outer membrane lipoprotein-sorting protein
MLRRTLLALALLSPLPARAQRDTQAAGDAGDIARVTAYLDSLHTLKARFIQLAPDGALSRGTVWLQRPGRMRFQYDPPTPLLLVAGNGLFNYYDSQLKQTSIIPLSQTPLGILLAEHVSFGDAVRVLRVEHQPGLLLLTVTRSASPGDGTLTLVFNDPPLVLRQWSVVDAQGHETRVSLFDVEVGGHFDAGLFNFVDPNFFDRPPGGGGNG